MRTTIKNMFVIALFLSFFLLADIPQAAPSYTIIIDQTEPLADFRKIDGPYPEGAPNPPTRYGLDHLKISGSAQFSESGLEDLIDALKQKDLIIIDLRGEPHGFINGIPISWTFKDREPTPLEDAALLKEEQSLLKEAQHEEKIVLYRVVKDPLEAAIATDYEPVPTTVKRTITESALTAKSALGYVRIPSLPHAAPSDEAVDTFITFYKARPEGSWVHFHCRGGKGRTLIFFIMVDMMQNAKKVSLDDIIMRQILIATQALPGPLEAQLHKFTDRMQKRADFFDLFYRYCKENTDHFTTSWSTWKNTLEANKAVESSGTASSPSGTARVA